MFLTKILKQRSYNLGKPIFQPNILNFSIQNKSKNNLLHNYYQQYNFCSNKFYNKYKLKHDPLEYPQYVINLDKESGLIVNIEKFDSKNFDPIKINKLREEQAKKDALLKEKLDKLKEENNEEEQRKDQEKQDKKTFAFINDDVLHGKFPTWFVSQTLLVFINIGVYLLWKISEESEGIEMKEFLEDNFTQHNTQRINSKGEVVEPKIFPNIILSGFSHQCFAHLLCNTGILLIFARRLTEYLGVYKFWGLYVGSLVGGYLLNSINHNLSTQNIKQDNMLRRLNIMRGQDYGYQNLRSDGGSDAIQALVAFTFCSLANTNFIYPQHLHYLALLILPTYFLEDLSNWFYAKKDTWNYQINKPHLGGFIFGIIFYFANEISQKQLKGNIDKRKLSVMGLQLWVYLIFYWYLNEKEYYGTRVVQNNLNKKHELIVNYYEENINYMKEIITKRYIQNFQLDKFEKCLKNIKENQIKHGDKPFLELNGYIQQILTPEDKQYVIKLLEQNYHLEFMDYKQAKQQRSWDFKNYN